MKAIFLADAHLRDPDSPAYRDLLNFFGQLPADLDRLFLLGDLFDFWHGYRDVVFTVYVPVLAALEKLSRCGVGIGFYAGNHEISCGPALEKLGSCTNHFDVVELGTEKLYLTHGDQLDPDDHGYHLWRALVRSRPLLGIIDLLPASLTWKAASRLSRQSRSHGDSSKAIPPGVYRRCAGLLEQEVTALVCGHFHQARCEVFSTSSGPRPAYFLGAWERDRSYLEWDSGRFQFNNFKPS